MLFITNRFPKQSIRSRAGRKFDFDLDNNAASNSIFFCEKTGDQAYTEIGSIDFLSRLKLAPQRQLLIYLHGFSNLPTSVFRAVEEFQALCDEKRPDEVLVVPLIWPCDNDVGIVKDYWDDQKSADSSAYSFARILEKFVAWRNSEKYNPQADPCLKRISVLAHSMGNRVLRETLAAWNRYDLADGVPLIFRNTFLVAADIVNESLQEGNRGELICHASRNVIVYYASDDLALRASKASNLRNKIASRRLGHTGPEDMRLTPANVYAVDCDDVNNIYDTPKGHSYFRTGRVAGTPGLVFEHIFETLVSGRVFPDEEFRRTTIIQET
ncbi:alpha/beta hydrolase [Sedimenticola hydrogenitrophicus]|uniref:alpha/beta hydrolase n=1 Tax=Sedimenticola hydrogenitrophicus TaxID=2967975 RepID=UPI0023AFA18B|nr:alpha/beta hydrolase [Sedimenticola hydrogenitrophicus]